MAMTTKYMNSVYRFHPAGVVFFFIQLISSCFFVCWRKFILDMDHLSIHRYSPCFSIRIEKFTQIFRCVSSRLQRFFFAVHRYVERSMMFLNFDIVELKMCGQHWLLIHCIQLFRCTNLMTSLNYKTQII